jgi:hypothetical protein
VIGGSISERLKAVGGAKTFVDLAFRGIHNMAIQF